MTFVYAFLFCGTVCMISQLILDNSKLTPGHVTSLFVVIGALLDIFGIYDKVILPYYDVTDGSIKEVLTIPFMQVAK